MMRRSISSVALLFASVSAILGSGWLFAAYYTSIITGPSAILSWLIGGFLVGVVAFTFAELSAMIPITGSSSRIPHYTHGTVVSFLFAWIIWLSYASLAPTEVQAVLQYLSYFFPSLTQHDTGALTGTGYIGATILMVIVSAINIFSLRWLLRANNMLTILKLLIPIVISIAILFLFLGNGQHIAFEKLGFFPAGGHGVFAAIAAGGIVFAFNGFKQACEMAGEAKKPKRSLPIAIIGSIIICLIIYLLLQFAFLSSVHGNNLMHGWASLHLVGSNSPFASVLATEHRPILLSLLYLGAIVGPLAAGLMYVSSASRSLYGMSKNDYIPLIFQKLTTQGNPVVGILVNFVLGMLMFLPLPGWDKMVTFLTSLMAITYSIAPICLLSLRGQAPDQLRPFKLPFIKLWSWAAFYICTLLMYWSGWDIISKLGISLLIGLAILFTYHFGTKRGRELKFDWKPSIWMWPYFIGISIISYLGNFGHGRNILPFGWDFIVIAAFCVFILWLSQKYKLPAQKTQAFLNEL
ncbi:MAG: APC family permease, partial [Coxiellaceae bacterium]|nr:APC family permease [Coxiellaceae bacterium]